MAPSPAAPKGRPYEAPKIFRVQIAGDELAVAGCKTIPAGGPFGGSCLKTLCKSSGS